MMMKLEYISSFNLRLKFPKLHGTIQLSKGEETCRQQATERHGVNSPC